MELKEIVKKLKKGDQLALAKSISIVENRKEGYKDLLKRIYPLKKKSIKIGISGTPGCGKSTIVVKIIDILRREKGLKVGVIAIDPSSPISGGAVLGDRIRMIQYSNDPCVFIRSMASRGSLGGLNSSIYEILDLFEAAGMDVIIIETVGVGQSEVDIVNIADVVAMTLTPYGGDEIQILKAGILEIADVFVINKSDLGGAEKRVLEIQNFCSNSEKLPIIVKTSALNNDGIDQLVKKLFYFTYSYKEQILEKKKKLKKGFILKIVQEMVKEKIYTNPSLELIFNNIEEKSPFEAADLIYKKLFFGGDDDKGD